MWCFKTHVVIAEKDFEEILKRIYQNKLVKGKKPGWRQIWEIYRNFRNIQESEGYQKMEATTIKRPDEDETDYENRDLYKGRGYIRLTGKENYRNANQDFENIGNFYIYPPIISSTVNKSWLISFWIWEKIIQPKITSIPKGSFTDNMIFFTKTLYPNVTDDATDDYLKLSLEIHKKAQDCVEEAQDQLRLEKEQSEQFFRGGRKLKSD
eukprot:GHVP01070520.1.p1 GENE.GHVP01070520.1~~GHVP01070520.1.p1  ORF type:complete len:209 (-),score=35.98 GHVP01070520.1:51-677(-)